MIHETCDDGNWVSSDGCSSTCIPEPGFTCSGEPSVCVPSCGDGRIVGTEACDDSNTENFDGCSSSCVVEPNYVCSNTPSVCSFSGVCGNGEREGTLI